eukprot:1753829-Amphidinium_carterae.2
MGRGEWRLEGSEHHEEPPPPPPVPPEHQHSMDLLADALLLKPFLAPNRLSSGEGTSLRVIDNTVEATHPGWQVVCARLALPSLPDNGKADVVHVVSHCAGSH